jgi:putative inorganic carbon (hco3(-)) transporter
MPGVRAKASYSSVTPSRARREASAISTKTTAIKTDEAPEIRSASPALSSAKSGVPALSRGHRFSYAALFAFTLVVYARPSEFYPSAVTASIAFVIGLVTLAFFIPTQLALEGNLSAPFVEVKLVVLFALVALLGVPLAMDPLTAWQGFSGTFIRCVVMFVVLVNVVRTTARLKGLLFLGMAAAIWLSVGAVNDYRLGLLTVEGYRVAGRGTGIFGNTLDMALHLVTMLPIALAFMFGARRNIWRILFGLCAGLMVAAIVLSYSRGAFIGLVATLIFLALRFGRRNRLGIMVGILVLGIGFLFLAPGNYGVRLLSIFVPSLDPVGSADARRAELLRSLYVAIRHPLLGIGMDNYMTQMSLRGIVTHNSYTQVAAELGLPALALYLSFIFAPLRKIGQIVREAADTAERSHFSYLAIGIQGSLIAYLVASFFLSVPFNWYVYYLVGYAVCLRRIYEAETGKTVVVQSRRSRRMQDQPGAFSPNATVGVKA